MYNQHILLLINIHPEKDNYLVMSQSITERLLQQSLVQQHTEYYPVHRSASGSAGQLKQTLYS